MNNPVFLLGEPGAWDYPFFCVPAVIFIDNSFYMFYTGGEDSVRHIGLATSADGIEWLKHPGNPVMSGSAGEWDEDFAQTGINVLNIDDTLHMWYTGAFPDHSIGHATSPYDPTSINISEYTIHPNDFVLEQNYPNPFNPKTVIRYALPLTHHVKLSVYNNLGQKVATLVNGVKRAGHHSVEWNAEKVSSGVYFYRLEAEGFSEVKKMVVMK